MSFIIYAASQRQGDRLVALMGQGLGQNFPMATAPPLLRGVQRRISPCGILSAVCNSRTNVSCKECSDENH